MGDSGSLLASLRVLDLSAGEGDAVSRILADLGADVLKVEPPGGSPARTALPTTGRYQHRVRPAQRQQAQRRARPGRSRATGSGCWIWPARPTSSSTPEFPAGPSAYGTSCADLADRFGHLVALSVTDFGTTGPRSSWRATDAVLYAMSSALSRSGPADRHAGTAAGRHRVGHRRGAGRLGGACRLLPPIALRPWRLHRLLPVRGGGAGAGSAVRIARSGRRGPAASRSGGAGREIRTPTRSSPCKDGYVRLVVMAPRQWRGMRAWLGEPAQFQDPKFDSIAERFAAWRRDRRAARRAVRRAHDGRTRGRRAGARRADRRGARRRRRWWPPNTSRPWAR